MSGTKKGGGSKLPAKEDPNAPKATAKAPMLPSKPLSEPTAGKSTKANVATTTGISTRPSAATTTADMATRAPASTSKPAMAPAIGTSRTKGSPVVGAKTTERPPSAASGKLSAGTAPTAALLETLPGGYSAFEDRKGTSTPAYGPSRASSSSHSPSVRSEIRDFGKKDRFRRHPTGPGSSFELSIAKFYHKACRTLMLSVGQGGTFVFGAQWKNEENQWVQHDPKKPSSSKVIHVASFGPGIRFIGTMECITCVGIYFEIEGHRIFFAHINAWHGADPRQRFLTPGGAEYRDIRTAVKNRLDKHSAEHGWSADDVDKSTLRMVCHRPDLLAYAVPDGIQEFLRLGQAPRVEHDYHGLIMAVGARAPSGGLAGKFLRHHMTEDISGESNAESVQLEIFEALPSNFEAVKFTDPSDPKKPQKERPLMMEEWTYSIGYGWHQSTSLYSST